MLRYLYIENPAAKKMLLWEAYGNVMVEALLAKGSHQLLMPMPSDNEGFDYLGERYVMQEVDLDAGL